MKENPGASILSDDLGWQIPPKCGATIAFACNKISKPRMRVQWVVVRAGDSERA